MLRTSGSASSGAVITTSWPSLRPSPTSTATFARRSSRSSKDRTGGSPRFWKFMGCSSLDDLVPRATIGQPPARRYKVGMLESSNRDTGEGSAGRAAVGAPRPAEAHSALTIAVIALGTVAAGVAIDLVL